MTITKNTDLMTTHGGGVAWWFLGTRTVVRNPQASAPLPVILEMTIPTGGAAPWHVHETLDELIYVLDGQLVVRCGEHTLAATTGSYLCLPAGVPHTFRVTSDTPARLLLIQPDRTFLDFIEAVGEPARTCGLPTDPPSIDHHRLLAAAIKNRQQILGPPITEADAREVVPRS
jgi:quercetin dioxygenase-like cupin family protein